MAYEIEFHPKAYKFLQQLQQRDQLRIAGAIEVLRYNPRPPTATLLKGGSRLWRIRSGDYRVIYAIEDGRLSIAALIGCRND